MENDLFDEHDEYLRDLLGDFEEFLRENLKESDEFQTLVEYLTHKHGTISLYVGAQVMGAHVRGKKMSKRVSRKKTAPIRFELNKNDLKFLRSLNICPDI